MVSSRRIPAIAILCIFIGERVDKEAINNDIESRACSQKSDVPHTNSSMHFSVTQSFLLGFSRNSDNIRENNKKKRKSIQQRAYQCI